MAPALSTDTQKSSSHLWAQFQQRLPYERSLVILMHSVAPWLQAVDIRCQTPTLSPPSPHHKYAITSFIF
jgi:hypothetical protein